VEFGLIPLYSPVVKFNESAQIFLLSVLSDKGNGWSLEKNMGLRDEKL